MHVIPPGWSYSAFQQLPSVVMGPGLRRDDSEDRRN
jgi:hypothetical protein